MSSADRSSSPGMVSAADKSGILSIMYLACTLALAFFFLSPALGQEPANNAGTQPPPPESQSPATTSNPPATAEPTPPATPDAQPEQMEPSTPEATTGQPGVKKSSSACGGKNSRKTHCAPRKAGQRRRVVIREGSTTEPTAQIAPGMTPEQAARQRQNTEQLLVSTGSNLDQLRARTLNSQQQETVTQIRNYMAGARSALKVGDLPRAHNLAFKAHLLADDLLKH